MRVVKWSCWKPNTGAVTRVLFGEGGPCRAVKGVRVGERLDSVFGELEHLVSLVTITDHF